MFNKIIVTLIMNTTVSSAPNHLNMKKTNSIKNPSTLGLHRGAKEKFREWEAFLLSSHLAPISLSNPEVGSPRTRAKF